MRSSARQWSPWHQLLLAAILIGNFGYKAWLALRPIAIVDSTTLVDDTYLSLHIARSIAHDGSPWYGLAPTSGFQPLYVFLAVPWFWLFDDLVRPVHAALVTLAAFDTASLLLLIGFARRLARSPWPPLLLAAAWVLNPYVILNTQNGLETAIAFFFGVAVLAAAHAWFGGREAALGSGKAFAFGALLGLSVFARIDNVFIVAAVLAVTALRWLRRRLTVARPLRTAVWLAIGGACAYGPWLVYSWYWTGDLYPISGRAVRWLSLQAMGDTPWPELQWRLLTGSLALLWSQQGLVLRPLAGLVVLAIALLCLRRVAWRDLQPRLSVLAPAFASSVALWAAYVFYVFTPWYWSRYFFPLLATGLLAMVLLLDFVLAAVPVWVGRALAVALAAALPVFGVRAPLFGELTATAVEQRGYMPIGVWANANFPPGTRIGGMQSGALGYFAESLVVVNLDGVVNRDAFEHNRRKQHLTYLRSIGLEAVVGWPMHLGAVVAESGVEGVEKLNLAKATAVPGIKTLGQHWWVWRVPP